METKATEFIPFLGPIGGPELIMILVVLAFPIVLVLFLVKYVSKPRPPALPPQPNIQERLVELDKLRSENLISEAEHEASRKAILENI